MTLSQKYATGALYKVNDAFTVTVQMLAFMSGHRQRMPWTVAISAVVWAPYTMTTSWQSPGDRSRRVQQPQETPDLQEPFAELPARVVRMWNWIGDDGVTRMHLVTCGHFRSHYNDDGHTIWSAVSENPSLHMNLVALCFIKAELWLISHTHKTHLYIFYSTVVWAKFYIAAIAIFDLLWLWPWPWHDDLHIQTWPVLPGDALDVDILTSYVKAFKSYHATYVRTDTNKIIYYGTSCVVKNAHYLLYTVNRKKRDILFLTITLANLSRFL